MDNPVGQPFIATNQVPTSPPPPSDTPVTTSSVGDNKPKPKLGKIVATLFGIILLVGGVGAGLVLVRNNQQLNQHAAGSFAINCHTFCTNGAEHTDACPGNTGSGGTFGDCNQWASQACSGSSPSGTTGGTGGTCPGNSGGGENCGGSGQACCTGQQNACGSNLTCTNGTCIAQTGGGGGGGSNWTYAGNCIQVTSGTVQVQTFTGPSCPTTQSSQGTATKGVGTYCPTPAQNSCQQLDVVGSQQGVCSCNTITTTPSPTPTPVVTPTATPGASAACTNIGAYDTSWNPLTQTQLSALKPGAVVRYAVIGTTTGTFDKARFTVNGTLQGETSLQHTLNSQNAYYFDYTIPTGITSFTVVAQLHSVELNDWF